MVSFLKRMGVGFAGDYNRTAAGQTIEPGQADPANPIPAYGVPVKYTGAGFGPLGAADTAANFYAFIARPFPSQAMPPNTFGAAQSLSTPAVPPTQGAIDLMRRGYMVVTVNSGSAAAAAKAGQVYCWTAATTTGHTQGGVEATETPGSTIALPATFQGPVDANNNTEIAINI